MSLLLLLLLLSLLLLLLLLLLLSLLLLLLLLLFHMIFDGLGEGVHCKITRNAVFDVIIAIVAVIYGR